MDDFNDASDKDEFNFKKFMEESKSLFTNLDYMLISIPYSIVWGLIAVFMSQIGILYTKFKYDQ